MAARPHCDFGYLQTTWRNMAISPYAPIREHEGKSDPHPQYIRSSTLAVVRAELETQVKRIAKIIPQKAVSNGTKGEKGEKGDKGDPGSGEGTPGPQGPQGPQGDPGAQGPAGPQGNVGPQGPQGETGDTGATGATGGQGIQGIQGATGNTGSQGIQGIQGPEGPEGPEGPPGSGGGADPSYSPGSFIVATETAKITSRHLKLTTTQRATLQGTSTLRLT